MFPLQFSLVEWLQNSLVPLVLMKPSLPAKQMYEFLSVEALHEFLKVQLLVEVSPSHVRTKSFTDFSFRTSSSENCETRELVRKLRSSLTLKLSSAAFIALAWAFRASADDRRYFCFSDCVSSSVFLFFAS